MFLDEKMEKTVQLARDLGMKKNLDQLRKICIVPGTLLL